MNGATGATTKEDNTMTKSIFMTAVAGLILATGCATAGPQQVAAVTSLCTDGTRIVDLDNRTQVACPSSRTHKLNGPIPLSIVEDMCPAGAASARLTANADGSISVACTETGISSAE
jgi:hypothetical protein